MKRIARFLAASLVVFMLAGTVVAFSPGAQDAAASDVFYTLPSHDIIEIDGNSELNSTVVSEGWKGEGTAQSPFIIENYSIDAEGEYSCIDIRNTTLNIKIRNCTIGNITTSTQMNDVNQAGAIHLVNCSNIWIHNISIYCSTIGVRIADSENISISNIHQDGAVAGIHIVDSGPGIGINNCVLNNTGLGIALYYSNNFTISSNTIDKASYGITLYGCQVGSTDLNNVDDSSIQAIYIGFSNSIGISQNSMENNVRGIHIVGGDALLIEDNYVITTSTSFVCNYGLFIRGSSNCRVDGMEISIAQTGIILDDCEDTMIENLNTVDCDTGLNVERSDNITLKDSVFRGGRHGIETYVLSNSDFENIYLVYPQWIAIHHNQLTRSDMVNIEITGNPLTGLSCGLSEWNIFDKITMSTSEVGMAFYYCSNNNIWNCEVQSRTEEAVKLENSVGNKFVHNTFRSGDPYTSVLINTSSYSNEFYSNHLFNGGLSFPLVDEQNPIDLELYTSQHVEISNTYEGRFIIYLNGDDLEGNTLMTSYGQIFVVSSYNVIFRDQYLRGVDVGIRIVDSSNIQMFNTRVAYCQTTNILIHGSENIWYGGGQTWSCPGNGITIINSNEIKITSGNIHECNVGVSITNTNNVSIRSSSFSDINYTCIQGYSSNSWNISDCIFDDSYIAIFLEDMSDSSVHACFAEGLVDAFVIRDGTNITLVENVIENIQSTGIRLNDVDLSLVQGNQITKTDDGISAIYCNGVQLFDNMIDQTVYGIYLKETLQSNLYHNSVKYSSIGLQLYKSRNNRVTYNLFLKNNDFAIFCTNSPANDFTKNSFLQNQGVSNVYRDTQLQVFDDKNGKWYDSRSGGNYFSDLTSPDWDEDGLIDDFYKIDGGDEWDRKPLSFSPLQIISAPRNLVESNESLSIRLTWEEPEFVLDDKITGYRVYRSETRSKFKFIAEEKFSLQYNDNEVESGKRYYYQVRAICYLGAGEPSNIVYGFTDETAPSITILTPERETWYNSNSAYLSWIGSDPDSDILHYSVRWDDEQWRDVGNLTGILMTDLEPGKHRAYVLGMNGVGMTTTRDITFYVDLSPPILEFNDPDMFYTNTFSYRLEWQMEDKDSAVKSTYCRINGGEWKDNNNEGHLDITLSPGENIIDVRVTDRAGNSVERTIKMIFDGKEPVLIMQSPQTELDIFTNFHEIELIWTCEDLGSGIASYRITMDGGTSEIDLGPEATSYVLALHNNVNQVELKVWDNAGNWAYRHWVIHVDNSPPTIASNFPSGGFISVDVNISVVFSEPMHKNTVSIEVEDVSGRLSWSGNSLIFRPHELLDFGRTYKVTVKGADLSSNYMIPYTWEFSTIPSGTIKGRVLGDKDRPLFDAVVRLQNGRIAYTDNQGRFSFQLPPGDYTVTVGKDGYLTREFEVSVSSGDTKDLGSIRLGSEDALSKGTLMTIILIPSVLIISALVVAILFVVKKRNREMEFYVVDGKDVPKKKTVVEFEEEDDDDDEFEIIDYRGAPDYYSSLGLDRYASYAEIKRAYRSMAYMYHPDKLQAAGIDMDMEEIHVMMRELNEAKDTLLDPMKRQAYDMTLPKNGL